MSTCRFPFVEMSKTHPRPLLPIKIASSKTQKAVQVYALVDTGARVFAMPRRYIKLLGLSKWRLAREWIGTASGWARAHVAFCDIDIIKPKEEHPPSDAPTESEARQETVFDSPKRVVVLFLAGLSEPLVGVDDLLDKYVLKIDYPNEEFSLSKEETSTDEGSSRVQQSLASAR